MNEQQTPMRRRGGRGASNLVEEPRDFFMTLRDIAFWLRSARIDAALARLLPGSTPRDAFDALYRDHGDPYAAAMPQYRYQRRKYRALLSMLPQRQYRSALDIGCGIGVFTRELAPYADRVLGLDLSPVAVSSARSISQGIANVEFEAGDIETFESDERFSLIVLADVVYYLAPPAPAAAAALAKRLTALLEPNGLLLLVNHYFFGVDPQSRMSARIHQQFRKHPDLRVVTERRRAFYIATLLERDE